MRYFFGFLAVVALVVLVFILVLRGFGGSGQPKVQTKLTDYAATQTVMRMTIEGPINADQNHRVVNVTVGRNTTTINIIQGYEGRVIETQSYPNNETAYATFLRALQLQGFTKGDADPEKADSRGVCPTGRIYTFEVKTGSASVQRYWKSSCSTGTFKGNVAIIRLLFRAQIPDYTKLTRSIGLN